MEQLKQKGKVILAGAGPGDPELITVKLQKRLATTDVIIADRLVNPTIVTQYGNKDALIILAGKQGYNDASVSQLEINELICSHALQGKTVLRLKGGDVSVFGNLLDELQALLEAGISYEIIPGITAAAGAAAYAAIPLTARGYSQGVQFFTCNPNSHYSSDHWRQMATSGDTLVFYMSAKNVTDVAELLLRYTKKPQTPLAVIEQATTIHQQVHTTTLQRCALDFTNKKFSSPSLVIVGDVVNLHGVFNWFTAQSIGSVFNELTTQ
jgi:uroporphyrin-III C-methyltransferase